MWTNNPGKDSRPGNCSLDVTRLLLSERARPGTMKDLSLTAELACGELRTKHYAAADLKFSVTGNNGIFDLKPVTMNLLGGQGSGNIRADFAGAVPLYQVRYSLQRFHIEELLKTLSPQKLAEGSMDLAVDLSMRGKTVHELRRTALGRISLRGKNLTLDGRDLDREFARFESSQNFNLVDVGAYIFTGPFGLVVTKGYDFGRIFKDPGDAARSGRSSPTGRSTTAWRRPGTWAMATKENRIALQGALDLVNERFDEVTMALIDAKGCATVRQKIRGTFQKPVVEKPSTLKSLPGRCSSCSKR